MRRISRAILECRCRLLASLFTARSATIFALAAVWICYYLMPVRDMAVKFGERVQVFEPFLLLVTPGESFPSPFFLLFFFFIIMLSDAPSLDRNLTYRIVRMDRFGWCLGEIFHALCLSAVYVAWTLLVSQMIFVGLYDDSNQWSRIVHTLAVTDASSVQKIQVFIPTNVLSTYEPGAGFVHSLLLMLIYCIGSGLVTLFLHMSFPRTRPFGISVVLAVYFFDYVRIYGLSYDYARFSPAALARISFLANGYDMRLPSLRYAYAFLCLQMIVPGLALMLRARHYSTEKYR